MTGAFFTIFAMAMVFAGMIGMLLIGAHFERRNLALKRADKIHTKIMHILFRQDNWRELMRDFERVDFDEVCDAALKGKDTLSLYSPQLRALVVAPEPSDLPATSTLN